MITAKINFDTKPLDKLEREVPKRAEATITEVANHIVRDVTNSFYQGSSPSPVGGPPAIVTGELRDSVEVIANRDARGRFTFGKAIRYTAPYASALETATYNPAQYRYNRPFLQAAVERAEPLMNIRFEGIFRL